MGLFGAGRGRSRSIGSTASRPLLQGTDADTDTDSCDISLPGNDSVYLTSTKDGKPALGRKKPPSLLKDFGFDILGQSFGIPSRKDYERRSRLPSGTSRASGLITTPATPRPGRGRQVPKHSRQEYVYEGTESPMPRRKSGSSRRSSSTPAPVSTSRRNSQCKGQDGPGSQWCAAYERNPSFSRTQTTNKHHIPPPPPPPPPPPSILHWHNHSMMNPSMPPIHMNRHGMPWQSTHPPGYPYPSAAVTQTAPNWINPQNHIPVGYQNSCGVPLSQPLAMPTVPHHPQPNQFQSAYIPHVQDMPAARSSNIPPPPPPPPNWPQAHAMTTAQRGPPQGDANLVSDSQKTINHAGESHISIQKSHEKPRYTEELKQHLSKRIHHVHACSGCGKKRSTRYQRAHPLKRGEVPVPNYCYGCLKYAADTDGETSDGNANDSSSFKQYRKGATVVHRPGADEDRTILDSNCIDKKIRHGHRRGKKSYRFRPLSKLFSRRSTPNNFPPPLRSASSAEESKSRASSPASPIRRSYERTRTRAVRKTEIPALPWQEYAGKNTRDVRQDSLLAARGKEHRKAENEDKSQTVRYNNPIIARTRSRIPRPMPRLPPRPVDIGYSLSMDNGDSARPFDKKSGSPDSPKNRAIKIPLMPKPVEVASSSELSDLGVSNETGRTMKQETAPRVHNNEPAKRRIPSTKTIDSTDPYGGARAGDVRAGPYDRLGTPASIASNATLDDNADKPDLFDTSFRPADKTPLNHNIGVHISRMATPHRFPSVKRNERQASRGNVPQSTDKPEAFFAQDEPLTPTDAPHTSKSHPPRVVGDSWSDFQTDMEREAEEMAERDLASASKLFDSLSGSFRGSATSTFPRSSFVTSSNISIVSYYSDSDHNDCDATSPNVHVAEVEESVDMEEDNEPLTGQIEFSSEKEQEEKSTRSKTPMELSIAPSEHSSRRMAELLKHGKNVIYHQLDTGQDDDDVDYYSLPVGSSLIGHTGHSTDDVVIGTSTREDPDITYTEHRMRHFMQLPSA